MENVEMKKVYVKIKGINTSDGMINMLCTLPNSTDINVKTDLPLDLFQIGAIYEFKIAKNKNSERNSYFLVRYKKASELNNLKEIDDIYRAFDNMCPYSLNDLKSEIYGYLNRIENKVLKDITEYILKENETKFFTYPAAARLHHAYVGGLAHHTLGMLSLVDGFLKNYPFIDKDYMYAGTILHDIGKTVEFTGIENTQYAVKGQLLGHLVIGGFEVSEVAKKLGYENKEETMLLEHMIISHHGQPQFGACKKPQTAEAILLWYIDSLDSKLRVLGQELEKTNKGEFTESIGVLDKTKFYKHD